MIGVNKISTQYSIQVLLIEHDKRVLALSTDRADESFHIGMLRRRIRRGR